MGGAVSGNGENGGDEGSGKESDGREFHDEGECREKDVIKCAYVLGRDGEDVDVDRVRFSMSLYTMSP